jgi:glycosyltransferase involved in cell wall biosynthesis
MTKPWHRFGYHAVIHSILKKSRKIIAVSNHTKYDLMELYRIPEDKIAVIYEAAGDEFRILDKKSIEGIRRKFELSKPFLLYAGVWRNHKNLVNLMRAFHALRNSYGHDNMLVITGKDDPVYPEVKKTAQELKLEPFVRFTGLVSDNDLVALYNAASVYVHPSFYEGFGLNILEAFACGTPVACSNRSCLPEIAGDGNVLTFNPDNFRDMANVIHHLLHNDLLQKQLKERGLQRAKDFSWEKMARETLALYRDVV